VYQFGRFLEIIAKGVMGAAFVIGALLYASAGFRMPNDPSLINLCTIALLVGLVIDFVAGAMKKAATEDPPNKK